MSKMFQKINWKIVFGIIVGLIFLKTVLETSLIIITNKTMKLNLTKVMLMNKQTLYHRSNKQFNILLWTKWYQFKWMDMLDKHPKCEFTNCHFSDDRTKLNSSDAVVFHWYNIKNNDLPMSVPVDNQKWVLYNMESPHYTNVGIDNIKLKKIDWIMSYRTDSDIFTPYGRVVECKRDWKQRYDFENKTKSIAWFVSNCKTPSKREIFAKKLKEYIDIDIYGRCGPFKCKKYAESCIDMTAHKYKFYLAFENSICKDYVTEKAFHNMQYDIIPVVLGGANYSSIFPTNSYIDVFNFTSVEKLAKYLRKVANDKTLYKSYFEWKNNYCIERVEHNRNLCELCKRLNKNDLKKDFLKKEKRKKWWKNESKCRHIKLVNDTIQLVK